MSNGGLHHLRVRRRISKKPESYPSKRLGLRTLDVMMYGIAIINPLVLLPQLYDIYAYKNVAGLSLVSWLLLGMINLIWITYGVAHKEPPIYISSGFFALIEFLVVLGIVLFR